MTLTLIGPRWMEPGVKQKAYNFLDHAVKLYNDPSYASLRTNPAYAGEAESGLGCVLVENDHPKLGHELFRQAIAHQPLFCGYHNNLGIGT